MTVSPTNELARLPRLVAPADRDAEREDDAEAEADRDVEAERDAEREADADADADADGEADRDADADKESEKEPDIEADGDGARARDRAFGALPPLRALVPNAMGNEICTTGDASPPDRDDAALVRISCCTAPSPPVRRAVSKSPLSMA